jgi:N-acetylmuramoyl-L-alanine amidase
MVPRSDPPESPNRGDRRHGLSPDMVVLHYTAMESTEAAIIRLCDPEAEVSAHYVISETGQVTPLVPEGARAWHAGAGAWGNVRDVNSHSVGIELANAGPLTGFPPFPEPQMAALESLLAWILRRHAIPPERVIGHSDMAPGRKADPGPKFDWRRLALGGLSVWPDADPAAARWDHFKAHAQSFGYRTAEADDAENWQSVLTAFRLRFRPFASGALTGQDVGTMAALAANWPCADVDLGSAKLI